MKRLQRALSIGVLGLIGLAISGCVAWNWGLNAPIEERGSARNQNPVRAQVVDAIETLSVEALHELGLEGEGQTIFLIAPFEGVRPGFGVAPGVYLREIIRAVAPKAEVVPCETGGDTFYGKPVQLVDCLLEAQLQPKGTITVVGLMAWSWQPLPDPSQTAPSKPGGEDGGSACPNPLGERWKPQGPIFAGAGDFGKDGLAFPACLPGVTPVLATYDTGESGELPLMVNCRRSSIYKDELACFSNVVPGETLLAAPGAIIQVNAFQDVEVAYCCSTAISAAIAGAVTALLRQAFPGVSFEQILQAYQETGVPIYREDPYEGPQLVGLRLAAHRAYRWLEEAQARDGDGTDQPEPSEPSPRSVRDFDKNGDCRIDELELAEAAQALGEGRINAELFLKVVRAWVEQSNVCQGS